jgi:ubiquinone/menaquinone biosynthesis C-methylase UbiE
MKINLGCGGRTPVGWVNVDFGPGARFARIPLLRRFSQHVLHHDWDGSIFIHDLRKPLPWARDSIESIYSSHCLEHLTKVDGRKLLFEAFRVLKPGGIIRIVVPDLRHAVERYLAGETCATDFLATLSAVDTRPYSFLKRVFALLAGSGHRCMYDVVALTQLMESTGFIPTQMSPFNSTIANIDLIERKDRTENAVIVEGRKPDN